MVPRPRTLSITLYGLGDFDSLCMLEILQPVRVPDNMFKGYDFPI